MNFDLRQKLQRWIGSNTAWVVWLMLISLASTWFAGCSHRRAATRLAPINTAPCQDVLQQIDYPDLLPDDCDDEPIPFSDTPVTISNYREQIPLDMTLDQCVEMTLANSKVLQKLGGVVVNSPAVAATLFDQAIVETSQAGVEAALSDFDAQLNSAFNYSRTENFINTPFQSPVNNRSNLNFDLSKQTAAGTSFAFRNITDYNRDRPIVVNGQQFNDPNSLYSIVNQLEVRQPLLRGRGTQQDQRNQ